MPNPALNRSICVAISGCLLSSCATELAIAQDYPTDPSALPYLERRENFYGIRASGSMGTRLEIRMEPGRILRATGRLEQSGSSWIATTECEALAAALEAFRYLPVLKPGPIILQPDLPAEVPVAPRKTNGESWIIQTSAYAPDWSSNEIELRGSNGPYPFWVDSTVEAIKSCGPPAA